MSEQQPKPKAPVKSARRRAREFVVQALYQWQMTQESVGSIERFLRESNTAFVRADEELFRLVFFGAVKHIDTLTVAIAPYVDRPFAEISVVEKAILYAGAFEIIHMPQTPYPVIVNEAIELAKTFGGTDGHKFVNGVLDKLAASARQEEIESIKAKRQGA